MFDEAAIRKFKEAPVGCVDPDGSLIVCSVYQHKQTMKIEELFKQISAEYWADAQEQVDMEAEEAGDGYYHPEWHRFEIGDDSEYRAYQHAYDQGWLRLIGDRHHLKLYVEGNLSTYKQRCRDLDALAGTLGFNLTHRH